MAHAINLAMTQPTPVTTQVKKKSPLPPLAPAIKLKSQNGKDNAMVNLSMRSIMFSLRRISNDIRSLLSTESFT
jgi:hypothetical protein